jgi:regulator of cell morphogenesis and NO signaling
MKISLQDQISEIVTHDYRTAAIFKAEGIDFCCRGKRTLDEVIREKGIDSDKILGDLNRVTAVKSAANIDFTEWPLDLLIDYIEKKHHRYVKAQIPLLTEFVNKVYRSHGETHPELKEMRDLFMQDSQDLLTHLQVEEEMLFPVIRNIAAPAELHDDNACIPVSLLNNMINKMTNDHTGEGDRWRRINSIAENVQLGCRTAFVTFALLRDFEEDLHEHIHLENNILFPSAIRLKKEQIMAAQS